MTAQELTAWHKSYVAKAAGSLERETAQGDAYTLYTTSFSLHGMLSAVEGTGDEAELKQVVGYLRNMTASARKDLRVNGNTYKVWPNRGETGVEEIMLFQAANPIARAAAIINAHPQWKKTYAADAARFIDFVDASIIRCWYDKKVGVHKTGQASHRWLAGVIPWLPKSLGGSGRYPHWNDKTSHTGMIATYLYQASADPARKAVYEDIATRVAKGFRLWLRPKGAGWIWDDGTLPTDGSYDKRQRHGTHDTSHANREPMMMAAMYEAGLPEFKRADLERMARTVTDTLWNGDRKDPAFFNYIDGANAPYGGDGPFQVGTIRDGWAMMGRYSPAVQSLMERVMEVVKAGVGAPHTLGRYHFGASVEVGLSGHLLWNRARPGFKKVSLSREVEAR